ncbi:hypothetical protein LTS14_004394 [Recurvomyces mirabilis]|uniref:uncharacterized protein n=1 Tax=Recurvomyces mirabilis TaxID=574656 RepID=UPI002DE1E5B4|nr:hypothetical protein LTS14_004394 [Recurvomyces mirabilis]
MEGKAAFLVLEDGTRNVDRRFLAGGESQYAAIITVYEGRTKAPGWNEGELKTKHETKLRRGIYDCESAMTIGDEADRAFLYVQIAQLLEKLRLLLKDEVFSDRGICGACEEHGIHFDGDECCAVGIFLHRQDVLQALSLYVAKEGK